MNNLPKLVIALIGVSALLEIAEKIKKLWGFDEKNEREKKEEPSSQV